MGKETQFGGARRSPDVGKATQFGQPNGNKPFGLSEATNIRLFYNWALNKATETELTEYAEDESKPFARRAFCRAVMSNDVKRIDSLATITNQAHGMPRQEVAVESAPTTLVIKKS